MSLKHCEFGQYDPSYNMPNLIGAYSVAYVYASHYKDVMPK